MPCLELKTSVYLMMIRSSKGNTDDQKILNMKIDKLLPVAGTYDAIAIKEKLKEIVPEYTPQF